MNFRLTILFFFFTPLIFAQTNLITNPSFEDTVACPDNISQIDRSTGWTSFRSSPEYYNSCSSSLHASIPINSLGHQYPTDYTCKAYSGIYTYVGDGYSREFIGSQLTSPLSTGQKYYVSMKASLADTIALASNKLGLLFSTVSFNKTNPAPVNNFAHVYSNSVITDTDNWAVISGSFVADSTYKYIILGNFFNDSNTTTLPANGYFNGAYYYIDDVCVSTDSSYCHNYSFDCGVGVTDFQENKLTILPNPATSELTIDFVSNDKYFFDLFDLLGAKRLSVRLDNSSKTVDLTSVDSGVYVFTIVDNKGQIIKTDKLIIIK